MVNVAQAVWDGQGQAEWAEVLSEKGGFKLYITVMRDALKVDGIRWAASARDLQEIADMLDCLLLTPKVVDLIWLQATLKFNSIVNHRLPGQSQTTIVANLTSDLYSKILDDKIRELGGDKDRLIDSIGKYWVLHNGLLQPGRLYGARTACNYGWPSSEAVGRHGVTPGVLVWQTPGFRHDDKHVDPSQVVRLMKRSARLVHPDGLAEDVDLVELLQDPARAHLANHDGVLRYLRMRMVKQGSVRARILPYSAKAVG